MSLDFLYYFTIFVRNYKIHPSLLFINQEAFTRWLALGTDRIVLRRKWKVFAHWET